MLFQIKTKTEKDIIFESRMSSKYLKFMQVFCLFFAVRCSAQKRTFDKQML